MHNVFNFFCFLAVRFQPLYSEDKNEDDDDDEEPINFDQDDK